MLPAVCSALQAITVAYSQLRAAMFEGSTVASGPLQRLRYEARPRFVLLGAGGQSMGVRPLHEAAMCACSRAVACPVATAPSLSVDDHLAWAGL